ncbi:MAG: hypothetical protein WCJ30_00200 [Deltaproteobacteria bacterium]
MSHTLGIPPASLALFLAAGLIVTAVQCGPESTGHARTSFEIAAHGANAHSVSSLGWDVTFSQAMFSMGPLGWYEGDPLFGRLEWVRSLGIGVARAHPGHYVAGQALADITDPHAVDLLADRVELGVASGVTGTSNSGALELHTPTAALGPSGAVLEGHAVLVRGVAQRGGTTVRFRGSLNVDVTVRGFPARGEITAPGARWVLTVDLAQWLDRADFATLGAAGDAEVEITDGSQVQNAFYRGVTAGTPYRLEQEGTNHDQ